MNERELLERARGLAGVPIAAVFDAVALTDRSSAHDRRGKGAVGELIERALGLAPSSDPGPDFKALGIELKTLPVDDGRVVESTWVCAASTESIKIETWSTSRVRAKLARVLFVPVEARGAQRKIGTAFLWSPDDDDERTLRADWEDLADLVAHGLGFSVTARRGRALQLRPKAANASVMRKSTGVDGDDYVAAPQGFYLRRAFTQRVVQGVFESNGAARSR